jgi:syntaxin-binding protein 1
MVMLHHRCSLITYHHFVTCSPRGGTRTPHCVTHSDPSLIHNQQAAGDRDTKKLKFKSLVNEEEDEFELSRYKPVAQLVLSDHIAGRLDQAAFPYVRDAPTAFGTSMGAGGSASSGSLAGVGGGLARVGMGGLSTSARGQKTFGSSGAAAGGGGGGGSLRSVKAAAQRPNRPGVGDASPSYGSGRSALGGITEKEPIRQRVILFIMGGMTYSEMRAAYQVGGKMEKDVYIGEYAYSFSFRFCELACRGFWARGEMRSGARVGSEYRLSSPH